MKLVTKYTPMGDQPKAIKNLVDGLNNNKKNQVLLGATGTGKTFTMANVISKTDRTAIILSHNKTLAGQLYSEFKTLFPEDNIEYFISNFDYYKPEAYMPSSDTFIDKSSKSNWDIEAMRMSTCNSLVSGKRTIVVASVASIYGQINPLEYEKTFLGIKVGDKIDRDELLIKLVKRNYSRNNVENKPGTFRVRGDIIELMPGHTNKYFIRIEQFGDEIEWIKKIDFISGEILKKYSSYMIYPGMAYTTRENTIKNSIKSIKKELDERLKFFKKENKLLEYQRLEQRVLADIDSLEEYGVTSGIENYSRHFDNRKKGERPFTILDYVAINSKKRNKKPLMFIDESHMMIPQLNAMYNGDFARKKNLVDYGFRLPSALDNRPLKFKEFENDFEHFQKIFVSATPSQYELDLTSGEIVSQVIRPTGLLDPTIDVVKKSNQIEDIFDRIKKQIEKKERTFVLTTTKRMAEELSSFFQTKNINSAYIHSDYKTFKRDEILRKLRIGIYDVVVGINLLKEGIDISEVSLVLILDADYESFFRSKKALIQIIGRASRNSNGHVVMYGDRITKSMQESIDDTTKRRNIQREYNIKNNVIPRTIIKPIPEPLNPEQLKIVDFLISDDLSVEQRKSKMIENKQLVKKEIQKIRGKMFKAAREHNFERAAQLRDLILEMETIIN